MTRDALFEIWAPRNCIWSRWAKAVLFAHLGPTGDEAPSGAEPYDTSWLTGDAQTAVIIDLPGATGVHCAIALARQGFQPVPLYNACPANSRGPSPVQSAYGYEMVDVRAILSALVRTAPDLKQLNLPAGAPPAFLLDANRRVSNGPPSPGRFDNRSICFPTDFPSAAFLGAQGITTALLIQNTQLEPQADLSHTLLRWQQAGMAILSRPLTASGFPQAIHVKRPSHFGNLWYRLLQTIGLRPSPLGGYGGQVPIPGTGATG